MSVFLGQYSSKCRLSLGLELRNTCVGHSIPKVQNNLDSRLASVRQSSLCSQNWGCGSPDDSLLALSAILSATAMGPVILTYDHIITSASKMITY